MKPRIPTDPRKHPVTVEWIDAFSTYGWKDLDVVRADRTRCTILSRGYLVREDDEEIVFAQSVGDNDTVAELLTIPKAWVKRVHRK